MRNNSTWTLSALSPTPWPREAWKIPLTLLTIVGALFFAVAPSLVYIVIAAGLGWVDPRHPKNIPADQLLIAQLITYGPLGIYLLAVLPRVAHVSLRDLGIRRPTLRDIGVGVAGTVAMWLVVSVIGAAIAAILHRHDTETAVALAQQLKSPLEKILFFATACIVAPLIEELTFRVFLFNALTRYLTLPASIVVSGILFGLVHSSSLPQFATVSIPLALGGVVLAYVYASTRCFWSNVTTHALFNTINVVAILVFHAT